MEIKDISPEKFAFYSEIPEKTEIAETMPSLNGFENFSVDNSSLKTIGKEKIESLRKSIDEINEMIEGREDLSDEIIREGDKVKNDIDGFISDIRGDLSKEGEVEKVKGDLRKKKVEISEMQLNEKVSCWKDIAMLKKELREKERELDEREARLKMLNDVLGGK